MANAAIANIPQLIYDEARQRQSIIDAQARFQTLGLTQAMRIELENLYFALCEINHDLDELFSEDTLHNQSFINYLNQYVCTPNLNLQQQLPLYSFNTNRPFRINTIEFNHRMGQVGPSVHDQYIVNQIFGISKNDFHNLGRRYQIPQGILDPDHGEWVDRHGYIWDIYKTHGTSLYYGNQLANKLNIPNRSILILLPTLCSQ